MLLVLLSWLYALAAFITRFAKPRGRLLGYGRALPKLGHAHRSRAKPAWVLREIIRLKALMPFAGCRVIAIVFNLLNGVTRRVTVGKTYAANVIKDHHYEIEVLRRHIKNRRPRPLPKNLVWAVDLTGKATLDGKTQLVLGILEHASRAALWLEALPSKSSWTLVSRLIQAIRQHGKPVFLRTDNEAVFTSRVFRLALWLLGIRQQRTHPGCPWQNGRIERFFGTLKEQLDQLAVDSFAALNGALREFRFFYNHVRPHQNLHGLAPAEAWAGYEAFPPPAKSVYWFEAWEGLLSGYYLRR